MNYKKQKYKEYKDLFTEEGSFKIQVDYDTLWEWIEKLIDDTIDYSEEQTRLEEPELSKGGIEPYAGWGGTLLKAHLSGHKQAIKDTAEKFNKLKDKE